MTESLDNHSDDDTHSLQGRALKLASPAERDAALDRAFDYRGDVTIHTRDGQTIEGYIFDRRKENNRSVVRLIPNDRDERLSIPYDSIIKLEFTGRDTAAGKSWETWVKKYAQKKQRGEEASIHAEPLE